VARILGVNFSCFAARWLWRTAYLGKLPRLEKKVRVALDWALGLIFSKDIVQFMSFRTPYVTRSSEADEKVSGVVVTPSTSAREMREEQCREARAMFELGKNRIEALSDGIFAIAMTLLVLELHVPDLPAHSPNVQVAPALLQLWPKLATYAIAFLSAGVFWVGHHVMYHAIRRADRVLLALNILFFMFVSLLPFSTSVVNAFRMTQVAPVFFGANLTLIGWALFLQWGYAVRQRDMLAEHVSADYRSLVYARLLAIPTILTFTVLVCFWSVEISLGIYLLVLPFYMIKVERSMARRPEPAGQEA